MHFKNKNRTWTNMFGTIDLPELTLHDGDQVESRITIELFDALEGGDLVISEEAKLKVKERPNLLVIRKQSKLKVKEPPHLSVIRK